jgi:lipocalin
MGPPGLPGVAGHSAGPGRSRRRIILTVIVPLAALALVLGIVGAAVFSGSSTTASPPSTTPTSGAASQLLRSAVAAAGRVNAFHYVSTSTVSGPQGGTQKTIGDAGADSGRQVITAGKQKFTVLVVGTACYFKGNAAALVANLGLPTSLASAHAGQWISLARTDAPYASVYAAVTASSAISDNVTIVPQEQLPTTKVDGREVQTITGAIAPVRIAGQTEAPKGTASLAVRASAPHLPVRYTQQGTDDNARSETTVTFSRWGESVDITAPSGAVSYASLGSGSVPTTPGGTVLT